MIRKAPEIYDSLILLIEESQIEFQSTDVYHILFTKVNDMALNVKEKRSFLKKKT